MKHLAEMQGVFYICSQKVSGTAIVKRELFCYNIS